MSNADDDEEETGLLVVNRGSLSESEGKSTAHKRQY